MHVPTAAEIQEEIDSKTQCYRQELKHLRALLKVAEDREAAKSEND